MHPFPDELLNLLPGQGSVDNQPSLLLIGGHFQIAPVHLPVECKFLLLEAVLFLTFAPDPLLSIHIQQYHEVGRQATGGDVIEGFNETPELGRFVLVKGEDVCAGGIVTHKDLEN